MSHIPSHAMPHAKPHDAEDAASSSAPKSEDHATPSTTTTVTPDGALSGWGLAVIAGGVLALGAAAAAAVPLVRGRSAPKKVRRERKKPTAKKSAD